jgi:hypothetical protein
MTAFPKRGRDTKVSQNLRPINPNITSTSEWDNLLPWNADTRRKVPVKIKSKCKLGKLPTITNAQLYKNNLRRSKKLLTGHGF